MVVSSALLAVSPLGSIVAVAEDPPTTSALDHIVNYVTPGYATAMSALSG